MFQERLKGLRKSKGFTQEELASRLHVTRQTISKWEKGYSVPDAQQLQRLAEILEVEVAELLGGEIQNAESTNEIARALSQISEQMAIRNRRWRRVGKVLLWILGVLLAMAVLAVTLLSFLRKEAVRREELPEMTEIQPAEKEANG